MVWNYTEQFHVFLSAQENIEANVNLSLLKYGR